MQRTQTICLILLTILAVGFSLYFLKSVLLPFVISLFVVIACKPVLDVLESRLGLNRYLAFAAAFAIGTLILLLLAALTWLSIQDLSRNLGAYEARLNRIAEWLVVQIHDAAPEGASQQPESERPIRNLSSTDALNELVDSALVYLRSQMLLVASSLSGLLSYGVLILIFVFFLLLGQEASGDRPEFLTRLEHQVRQYLVMKTVISAVTGFLFGLALYLFGVPLAILFGFLAFLLNFIPNIGPLISMLTPVPFLILNEEMSFMAAASCLAIVSAIQFVSGNVVETRIMGKSFDVSPVVLLLSLMLFGLVWGIIGMFLATPIVSIIKIILQQHEPTRPLAEWMAGRMSVPLTPPSSAS